MENKAFSGKLGFNANFNNLNGDAKCRVSMVVFVIIISENFAIN